ncbi:MAG: IS6 family transposase [Nitrospira sp.]|nr:IS6 family transposase [Nitrospira sp.]MCA9499911.1 IS6 family transposase [Nitrospira sp.]
MAPPIAVDQDGDTLDILVQRRRNKEAVVRFFHRLFKDQGCEPRWIYTDKLKSYNAAHREMMSDVKHINTVYANNRVKVLPQPTRQQEYHIHGFASAQQAQRFLTLHGLPKNLLRLGHHLMQAVNYRKWGTQSFQVWRESVWA